MVKKHEEDQQPEGLDLEPTSEIESDPNLRPVAEQADIQQLDAYPPE